MSNPIKNRYDFIYLFDVKDGNPNGDPDADNLPRVDPETSHGLVTDVCLKRKVRNFVQLVKQNQDGFDIYVKEKAILNQQHEKAFNLINSDKSKVKTEEARSKMCELFYDVRTFGAVMSTGDFKCGQVKGPIQLTFARSFDPIVPSEHTITRMAVTKEEKDKSGETNKQSTMGRKHTIPYGLYKAHGFISAYGAKDTGFDEDDLALFWQSLINMFDHDRSASRGEMTPRGLFVFKHESEIGNAPAHQLFDLIQISKRDDVIVPRQFSDYIVTVSNPKNSEIELIQMI